MSDNRRPFRLDYDRPAAGRRLPTWATRRNLIVCTISGLVLMFMVKQCLPSIGWRGSRSHAMNPSVACMCNLRTIGLAIQLYSNDHGGCCPDRLGDLLPEDDLVAGTLICPSSNDTAATGATTQATANKIHAGGHLSYIYLGRGKRWPELNAHFVVAYEPLRNHAFTGMNVLYGDGHTDWVTVREAAWLQAELAAGFNPPRNPATQPTLRPGR